METWRTVHPRWILHAPGAISVHGSISPGEPRTQALRFGAEYSSILATVSIICSLDDGVRRLLITENDTSYKSNIYRIRMMM